MRHTNVFVCGLHRSATSVLARLLRHHPEVSGFKDTGSVEDEGQFLQTVYPPAYRYGGPGAFGLNPRSHLDETSPLVSPENAAKLHAEWARYWDLSCPFLLEKSPPNLVRTRFLQSMVQDARFVVILRHPIAVSAATAKRGGIPFFSLVEHWIVCHERFLADRAHLNQVHVLWYEDLVARPVAAMDEIWRFLELESVPLTEPLTSHNAAYLAQWGEWGQSTPRGRVYQDWICRRFEARVRTFGYSLVDPTFLSTNPLVARTDATPRPSRFSRAWAAGMACREWASRGPPWRLKGWLRSQ